MSIEEQSEEERSGEERREQPKRTEDNECKHNNQHYVEMNGSPPLPSQTWRMTDNYKDKQRGGEWTTKTNNNEEDKQGRQTWTEDNGLIHNNKH